MEIDGITLAGVDSIIQATSNSVNQTTDASVKAELRSMLSRLSDMRVALIELENLEDKYSRGDVTASDYFDRRKKLVRDLIVSKDLIANDVVPKLAERAPTTEKSKLMSFKELLSDNKYFITKGVELAVTVAKIFGLH